MKTLSRIVFTIIYLLAVTLIIYLPTRERHFQGEIVKMEFIEDDNKDKDEDEEEVNFFFASGPDISLTIRDSNGKQYIVLMGHGQSFKYSNANEVGYYEDLKIGDYVKGTYDNTFLGNIKYAKEITLIVK